MNINSLKEEVDQSLKAYFNKDREYNKVLYDSMAYSINVGGKRIRPILMLLSYYIYKSDYKKIFFNTWWFTMYGQWWFKKRKTYKS